MYAVETQELSKGYGKQRALQPISLAVKEGEVFGLLGPSGCGKTTLLRVLCALEPPTTGGATVAGADLRRDPAIVRARTGVVLLKPCLDPSLSVYQNLDLFGAVAGVGNPQRTGRAIELLHLLELFSRRDTPVEALSLGLRRRADMARALIHEPAVLLWDEPQVGFDPAIRKKLWDYFQDRRASGPFTVVMATSWGDAVARCQRVAVVDRGRVLAINSPSALRSAASPDVVSIRPLDDSLARKRIRERLRVAVEMDDGSFRLEVHQGDRYVSEFLQEFAPHVSAVAVRRPTLDDVLVRLTARGGTEGRRPAPAEPDVSIAYDLTPPSD